MVVFTDFDLSMMVSVPTSIRPIDLGSILYFSRRLATTEAALGKEHVFIIKKTYHSKQKN